MANTRRCLWTLCVLLFVVTKTEKHENGGQFISENPLSKLKRWQNFQDENIIKNESGERATDTMADIITHVLEKATERQTVHGNGNGRRLSRREVNHTCPEGGFRCSSGRCVHQSQRCDGNKHCSDGLDEIDCAEAQTTFKSGSDFAHGNNSEWSLNNTTRPADHDGENDFGNAIDDFIETSDTNYIETYSIDPDSTLLFSVNVVAQVTLPIFIVLGTFGNVMTILVLRKMQSDANAFPLLFMALAITDLLVLNTTVLVSWLDTFSSLSWNISKTLSHFILWVLFSIRTLSTWLLTTMTILRTLQTVFPFRMRRVRQRRLFLIVITVLVVMCLTFNSLLLFVLIDSSSADFGKKMASAWVWMSFTLDGLLPFVTIVICNSLMIRAVVRSSRRRLGQQDQTARTSRVTLTLILVSIIFAVLIFPEKIMFLIMATATKDSTIINKKLLFSLFPYIMIFLWAINAAINFYIYILTGTKFRGEIKKIFSTAIRMCTRTRSVNHTGPEHREMAVFQ